MCVCACMCVCMCACVYVCVCFASFLVGSVFSSHVILHTNIFICVLVEHVVLLSVIHMKIKRVKKICAGLICQWAITEGRHQ